MNTYQINGLDVSLVDGCLSVSRDGTLILKTKGNPQLVGNPPFPTLQDAIAYFELLGMHLPVGGELPNLEEEASVIDPNTVAPLDTNDPAVTASTLS